MKIQALAIFARWIPVSTLQNGLAPVAAESARLSAMATLRPGKLPKDVTEGWYWIKSVLGHEWIMPMTPAEVDGAIDDGTLYCGPFILPSQDAVSDQNESSEFDWKPMPDELPPGAEKALYLRRWRNDPADMSTFWYTRDAIEKIRKREPDNFFEYQLLRVFNLKGEVITPNHQK